MPPQPPDPDVTVTRAALAAAGRRQGLDEAAIDAIWAELGASIPPTEAGTAPRRLGRGPTVAVVAGALLLDAAAAWWISWIGVVSDTSFLLLFSALSIVAFVAAAEIARRRAARPLDAAFATVASVFVAAAAYGALAVASGDDDILADWWARALCLALALIASIGAWRRFGFPLLTLLPASLAGLLLAIDALEAVDPDGGLLSGDATDRWWVAVLAVLLAGLANGALLLLDRRGLRREAFWPSIAVDAGTVLALVALSDVLDVPRGVLVLVAGILVGARGFAAGRLAQIGIGGVLFWVGAILVGYEYGGNSGDEALITAILVTLAGVSLLAGAVLVARKRDLIRSRRLVG